MMMLHSFRRAPWRYVKITSWLWAGWRAIVSSWNCCSTSSDAKARPSSVPTNAKMHAKTFSWSRPRCKDMLSPATVLRCRNSSSSSPSISEACKLLGWCALYWMPSKWLSPSQTCRRYLPSFVMSRHTHLSCPCPFQKSFKSRASAFARLHKPTTRSGIVPRRS